MPTIPGCTEHHLKLSSVLAEAHSNHKSLAICWLDLANAYGSVHHSLIQFSLRHYHAPPPVSEYPAGSLQSAHCEGHHCRVGDPNHPSSEGGVSGGSPLSGDFQHRHEHPSRHCVPQARPGVPVLQLQPSCQHPTVCG